jgi:hypothetical protein
MRRVLRAAIYLAVASLAATGAWATDAPEVTDNPVGKQYLAEMPASGNQAVIAEFSVRSLPDGSAVAFTININGAELGPGPFRKSTLAP